VIFEKENFEILIKKLLIKVNEKYYNL